MNYEMGRLLARGRRAAVYLARDTQSGESVAMKLAHLAGDFSREHGIARALAGPHTIRVLGHGQRAEGAWLAMEYAEAGHVPAVRVEPLRALALLRGAAKALAPLHAAGWVHRDVKHSNLLLRAGDEVVLTDFGSACRAGERPPASGDWTLTGTPRYCAPEQARGDAALPAADIYSLGVMLHEWLTGTPPFAGETPAEVLAQHLLAPLPVLPAAFANWQLLSDKLLAKNPAARPADGAALLAQLNEPGIAS